MQTRRVMDASRTYGQAMVMIEKMMILCVDDDDDDIDVFYDAIRQVDSTIKCVSACNGKKAMELLRSEPLPDYIFLDINMPVMDGMETLKAIRKDKRLKKTCVVVFSTTRSPREIDAYLREGANHFLRKPDHFDTLCKLLTSIFGK